MNNEISKAILSAINGVESEVTEDVISWATSNITQNVVNEIAWVAICGTTKCTTRDIIWNKTRNAVYDITWTAIGGPISLNR